MTDERTAAEVALSAVQRALVLESERGAFGRDDDGTGADLIGSGRWAAARALERKGLGDVEETPNSYPQGLYFNNSKGLRVRDYLLERGNEG